MQGHYGSLAADTTGHSLDLQYWHDRQPIQVSPNTPLIRNSDILDQDFSWNQIAAALLQMKSTESTWRRWYNHCVLPSGTLYACQHPRRRSTNPFARALLRVCGQVFASATIPRAWLCASIVPSTRKMATLSTQATSEALPSSMHCTHPSSARARAGSLLSDPFPVQRGVRQGCPLSGLLFNLFINDILDGVAPITVPGLPRDTNPIRGLMYADDVAVFADSEQSLLAASTAIEQWANRWEMQFGVAKCGIISFTGHLAPRLDNHWIFDSMDSCGHGKAYYGLELVGGNKSHLAPLTDDNQQGYPTVHWCPTLDCHWTPSG
ncbi:hypothetical protein BASA83_008118 [Batrachochytrium salamandrivorans]|nr:hypothetical protein BASA83_008118 [Batrachochytrium salamandrivorans]